MKDQEARNLTFISGGCLSKASYNKLQRYRESISKNYDSNKKKEVRQFVKDLQNGIFDKNRLIEICRILNLVKPPVDEMDYQIYPHFKTFQYINLLKQFIQRNMTFGLLKKLHKAIEKNYEQVYSDNKND